MNAVQGRTNEELVRIAQTELRERGPGIAAAVNNYLASPTPLPVVGSASTVVPALVPSAAAVASSASTTNLAYTQFLAAGEALLQRDPGFLLRTCETYLASLRPKAAVVPPAPPPVNATAAPSEDAFDRREALDLLDRLKKSSPGPGVSPSSMDFVKDLLARREKYGDQKLRITPKQFKWLKTTALDWHDTPAYVDEIQCAQNQDCLHMHMPM